MVVGVMGKSFHETATRFFENPTRDGFRQLIEYNYGEQNNLDFKGNWPELSKVSRHVLALSNSGGGIIVFGVSEINSDLQATGLEKLMDKADISNGMKKYLSSNVNYEVLDFHYDKSEYNELVGKKFQILIVEYDEMHIPFVSMSEGNGIKNNAIYIRRGTSSEEPTYEELQKLLNTRISTQFSTNPELKLEEHLAQLKILFSHIKRYHLVYNNSVIGNMGAMVQKAIYGEAEEVVNANYPSEGYESFIARMIEKKKKRIERLIDN